MSDGAIIVGAFYVVVVVGFILWSLVFFGRCPSCRKWRCGVGHASTVAGEVIYRDAHCRFCGQELEVDRAGYITYRSK